MTAMVPARSPVTPAAPKRGMDASDLLGAPVAGAQLDNSSFARLLRRCWEWVQALPSNAKLAGWIVLAIVFGRVSVVLVAAPVVIGLWLWELTRPAASRTDLRRWIRHLAEMVVAMFAGMMVYHILIASAVIWLGFGWLVRGDLGYAWMTLAMVVPMVALMRFQGHSWRMSNEMAAGMTAPIVVCFALVRLGICPLVPFLSWLSESTVYMAAYYGMLLGMMAAMVYRRNMYPRSVSFSPGGERNGKTHD